MKTFAVLAALLFVACTTQKATQRLEGRAWDLDVAMERGLAKVDVGDEAGAIEDFTRALEIDPSIANAWRWRGHCLNKIAFYEDALSDYDRALAIEPLDSWTHYAHAMSLHNLRRYDAALVGYTRSLEIDPQRVKAWDWRGFTRTLTGDFKGAAGDFRRSIELDSTNVWTHLELAKAELALDHLDACEQSLLDARELAPSDTSVRAQLGFLAAVRGTREEAIAHLAFVVEMNGIEETHARIWIWMQSADPEVADLELGEWFAEARIEGTWEQHLVAFLLGESTDDALAAHARAETATRVENGEWPDFLECEAAFFAGVRHERRGEVESAHSLYARALRFDAAGAWEWHMARARLR